MFILDLQVYIKHPGNRDSLFSQEKLSLLPGCSVSALMEPGHTAIISLTLCVVTVHLGEEGKTLLTTVCNLGPIWLPTAGCQHHVNYSHSNETAVSATKPVFREHAPDGILH